MNSSKHPGHGRTVILTQWFPPEHAPIGYMLKELAQYLADHGQSVEVVTGFPNHPSGKVQAPYVKRRVLREQLGKVNVTRLWLFTSESRTFLSRALNFLSFVLSSFFYLLTCPKPALVFAVLQPLPLGATLVLLAKIRGFKLVFNVQDLHPDVLVDLGLLKNPMVIGALRSIEKTAYCKADGLAVICEGFKEHACHRGAPAHGVQVIPNWIDMDEIRPVPGQGESIRNMANIPRGAKVLLYAGTIGHVSGAQVVLQAAQLATQRTDVYWLFVGEGPLLPALKNMAQGLPQVRFLPFQPRSLLLDVQNCATVSLVSLLPGKGLYSVPSKVLGYMAAARPVVASVDLNSETGRLVQRAQGGVVVPPAQPQALWSAIEALLSNEAQQTHMGSQGRAYLENGYSRQQVCARYLEFFNQIQGVDSTT